MRTREVEDTNCFFEDASGLSHFIPAHERIEPALEEAIKNKPQGATWFWFNGTPAPMVEGDTVSSLHHRWNVWKSAYHFGYPALLEVIEAFSFDE
jgi:hypothetical protein